MPIKNDTISMVSLDVETLSVSPQAAVVSIALVHIASIKRMSAGTFKKMEGNILPLYMVANAWSQVLDGAVETESCKAWWRRQPKVVQQVMEKSYATIPQEDGQAINKEVASEIHRWSDSLPGSPVWVVQGADFDLPIVNNFLDRAGQKPLPGHYRHKVCLRTLSFTAQMSSTYSENPHNALADAESQKERFQSLVPEVKKALVNSLFTAAGYE